MEVAYTFAYYDTAILTAVKSFIVQAPGTRSQGISSLTGVFLVPLR